ncbi:hypothetical protein BH10PSE1_BH10PSE1_09490 [soil metagenome]
MTLIPTLLLLAACLAVLVFTGWRGARPPDITRGPRMAPWRFLMLLSGALTFFVLVHLATLFGFARPG